MIAVNVWTANIAKNLCSSKKILLYFAFYPTLPYLRSVKRFVFILLTSILVLSAYGQRDMYRYSLDFTLGARHFVDTIPIEFVNNQLYVNVYTQGRKYRFCIDTGSSQGIAYRNGSMPYGEILGRVQSRDANNRIDTIHAVRFPDFRLGHLHIRGYSGSLLHQYNKQAPYDAIIGFDLFNKGLYAKIDTRAGYMVLTDMKEVFAEERGYVMRYHLERFVPHIKVSPFPKCEDDALFDTGSRRLYVMNKGRMQTWADEQPDFTTQIEGSGMDTRVFGAHGSGRSGAAYYLWLDDIEMGGYHFSDYHTTTTLGNSRVGGELLHYGSLVINSKKKRLIFQPYDGTKQAIVNNEQKSIAFSDAGGRVVVTMVWQGGKHYSAGFRSGQVLTAINDYRIDSWSDFQRFRFIDGMQYTFTVYDPNGGIHQIISER